ncbi:MAG TPA: ABC transporter permease [Caulobacteraceae bacterium]|jgi:ABC-2 type transport system permease protein
MRRLWIIALREYLSYARTGGFWLSLALMPMAMAAGAFLPGMLDRAAPTRNLAIVDLTGGGLDTRVRARLDEQRLARLGRSLEAAALVGGGPDAADAVEKAFEEGGPPAARRELERVAPDARAVRPPSVPFRLVESPPGLPTGRDQLNAALRPYIAGERTLDGGAPLDAAAVLHRGPDGAVAVDLWNANLNDPTIEEAVRTAVREEVRRERLAQAGVSRDVLRQVEDVAPAVRVLSPKAQQGGEVSLRDRLPALVGFVLGLLLWSAVITGAGILLNSVMEEKSNRVLEILAASATTTEIMGGKILGVAALTATVLGGWAVLGLLALNIGMPSFARDLSGAIVSNGFLGYFALYAVFGYLMYAAIFAAIGAFCETTRDAQAMLGPIMILLTVPILFMGLALKEPNAELLRILSWVPLFTPFLMMARAAGELPWWEIVGTLALMAITTVLVVQLAGRAFHAGALSTSKPSLKGMLGMLRR